jgi:hypothetical protein
MGGYWNSRSVLLVEPLGYWCSGSVYWNSGSVQLAIGSK